MASVAGNNRRHNEHTLDAKRILELYKNPSCCCLFACLFCCFVQEHTVRSINCSYSGKNKALLRFFKKTRTIRTFCNSNNFGKPRGVRITPS